MAMIPHGQVEQTFPGAAAQAARRHAPEEVSEEAKGMTDGEGPGLRRAARDAEGRVARVAGG